MEALTRQERKALSLYWRSPLRIKNGNVELKKGECWGILCSVTEGKKNAQMILQRQNGK